MPLTVRQIRRGSSGFVHIRFFAHTLILYHKYVICQVGKLSGHGIACLRQNPDCNPLNIRHFPQKEICALPSQII